MILNLGRKSKNLTKAEKERKARLKRSLKASTQNTIKYNSLFENGLMHIAKNEWSRTYRLGDVAYISANQEEKIDVIDTHAEALNSRPISEYSSSGSTMIILSSGFLRYVGIISIVLTVTDLPEPDEPSTTPEPVLRSALRSTVITLLDN